MLIIKVIIVTKSKSFIDFQVRMNKAASEVNTAIISAQVLSK